MKATRFILAGVGLALIFGLTVSGTPAANAPAERQIPMTEVARHNTAANCWTAINGGVYDVTAYVRQHPGGAAILAACGRDASALMAHRPGTGAPHSPAAYAALRQYRIGAVSS